VRHQDFHDKIRTLRQRVEALQQHTAAGLVPAAEALSEAFEDLHVALEELHVAHEELRQQNEELTDMRLAIEAERQRYQELFDFAPDAYLVTDGAGIITEANRAAAALLATSQHRLMGKPLAIFVAKEERYPFRTRLAELPQLVRVQSWEVRLKPQRGGPFEAALDVASFRTSQDTPVGLRWLLRDITVHKRAEQALRESEARARAVLETTVDGIITIDEQGIVESFNLAAERMYGYTAREVIGQNVSIFRPTRPPTNTCG
jgi:PAS domain S-box-containing protein